MTANRTKNRRAVWRDLWPNRTRKPTGYVIWRGVSDLDGSTPLACVLVVESDNAKTGNMLQTYIVRSDVSPLDAYREAKTGAGVGDAATCFGCKHRHSRDGECYVNLGHGPRAVFDALSRGMYPDVGEDSEARHAIYRAYVSGRPVRIGSYGEPVLVPIDAWFELTAHASTHTGYTHRWFDPSVQAYSDLLMASVDSESEARCAALCGWRYFRVRSSVDAPIGTEIVCPASVEFGKARTCADCTLCGGLSTPHAKSVVIVRHGFRTPRAITRKATAHGARRAARRVSGSVESLSVVNS